MKKLFGLLLIALVVAAGWGHYVVRMEKHKGFTEPVIVEIPRGASTLRIGGLLAEKGVVAHPYLFALARLVRPKVRPQAGEYLFKDAATPWEVYSRIARGDVYTIEVRVPEGSDAFDLAGILETAGFGKRDDILKLALREEGFLFPSTYRFRPNARPEQIVRAMRVQFDKVWEELGQPAALQREFVTLASLVEKEAKLSEERRRIAGVYRTRLDRGIKLDCDPTVIYAAQLLGRWRGTIYKSDLERDHPYNTYVRPGLPPGPIANPGRASLEAALKPDLRGEIFFVAKPDGSGGHIFSRDAAAHNKAVAEYRRGRQAAQ
jgi:UPF0755 protein